MIPIDRGEGGTPPTHRVPKWEFQKTSGPILLGRMTATGCLHMS